MACCIIAAWTSVVAIYAIRDRPGWALIFAAIAGFALGIELMVLVYEDERRRLPTATIVRGARLRLVHHRGQPRPATRELAAAHGGSTVAAPRTDHT